MTYQMRRMVLVNLGTNQRTPSGLFTEIDPRGSAAVVGANGVGKTTTLRLIPLFFGHLPSQIMSSGKGQEAMLRFVLPMAQSAIVFEYQRGPSESDDVRLAVIRRRQDGGDAPEYRFFHCGFRPELFSADGNFLDDEQSIAAARDLGVSFTSKLSGAEYRSVILGLRANSKDAMKLRRLSNDFAFGPKPLPNLDRLVAAMIKDHVNFGDLVQVAVGMVHEQLGDDVGADRNKMALKQSKGSIARWLVDRDACAEAVKLRPRFVALSSDISLYAKQESILRSLRSDVRALLSTRSQEKEKLAGSLQRAIDERQAQALQEVVVKDEHAKKWESASRASTAAGLVFEEEQAKKTSFEKSRATYWESRQQTLPALKVRRDSLDGQVEAAGVMARDISAQYDGLISNLRVGAANESENLEKSKGGQGLEESIVIQWLWGFLAHLRRRGAVFHPELVNFASDGNLYGFLKTRNEWMPSLGSWTPRPIFLTLGQHKEFDKLSSASRQQTWFDRWAAATVGQQMLLSQGLAEALYLEAIRQLESQGILIRTTGAHGDSIALDPARLILHSNVAVLVSGQGRRNLTVPKDAANALLGMPCLDATQESYDDVETAGGWLADRFSHGDLRRVISAEHTGLLGRSERELLEIRFKSKTPQPWYENLLSATPTLEMGVDIGDLSSVLLCSVPPNQASYLQRIGRAGRRDGNAVTTTLADGASPHDLYFFAETQEMIAGAVTPPGVFLKAAEVLRRQLFAFCIDDWVGTTTSPTALPDRTSMALDAVERADKTRFPYTYTDHVLKNEPRLLQAFLDMLGSDIDENVTERLTQFMQGTGDGDGLRMRLMKVLEELMDERKLYKKRAEKIKTQMAVVSQRPTDESAVAEIDQLKRERDKVLELTKEINQRELLNTLTDAGLIPNYAFTTCVIAASRAVRDGAAKLFVSKGIKTYVIEANKKDVSEPTTVRFSTMHRAKGLEFDQVLVLVPREYLGDPGESSNERKLLYVAITRAKRAAGLVVY
jgi:Protein of unknown function (DUF3584)/UvrD-like helicase C-terminal domain/Helicase conserved C-terminal domain